MRSTLRTKAGKVVCSRRKVILEPYVRQSKGRDFCRLLLRGSEKARGEWVLTASGHNLMKYHRLAWQLG